MVSGTCSKLAAWLSGLDLSGFNVRIWCYTDRCTIGQEELPADEQAELLERARLFGEGGDLEVWRTGEAFRWRFVGRSEYAPGGKEAAWPENAHWRDRRALLWGTRSDGQAQWYDDRVAGAALTYPLENAPERVWVKYREYTEAGRPFAVWFTGLEGYDG
jgi:hypothetical protein